MEGAAAASRWLTSHSTHTPDEEDCVWRMKLGNSLSFVQFKKMEKGQWGSANIQTVLFTPDSGLPGQHPWGAGGTVPIVTWDHFHSLKIISLVF